MFDRFGNWNNFPIGLRVLAVDSDWDYLNAIKTTLESYQYVVSAFTSADDALAALHNAPNPFHVALVEAATKDSLDGFKILKTATTIPTIMMSNGEDMPLMMQSIALGAADFLQKPVSEEKLRNIWQHVARKALNAGDSLTSTSMPSIARSDPEMTPQIKVKDEEQYDIEETGLGLPSLFTDSREIESTTNQDPKLEQEEMISSEATPLEIEAKVEEEEDFCYKFSLDDIGLTDAIVPQHTDLDSCIFGLAESDTDSALDVSFHMLNSSQETNFIRKEDQHIFKSPSLLETSIGDNIEMPVASAQEHGKGKSRLGKESKCPNSKKKMKIDWTPDLHRKFVQAVEQLGVDKAIPSRILELMGVKGLTRHNVASHLQKYRSHRKHLLIREAEAANWQNRAWYRARNGWSQNPVQPRQPLLIPTVPLHVWGHPTSDYSAMHMWQNAPPQTPTMWQAPDGTMWQHPGTWVEPVPVPGTPVLYPQTLGKGTEAFLKSSKTVACSAQDSFADNEFIADAPTSSGDSTLTRSTNELPSNPSKQLVDAMISEALSNPSTTLPLGLKPPSMESVVAELGKKGIVIVPSGPSP